MAIVAEVFDDDDGGGGGGEVPPPNGGGGGGGDGDEDDDEEKEFGQLIGFKEVMKVVEEKGVELPGEMFEAAKGQGLREVLLTRYLDLQGSGWALGFLTRNFAMFRNRMLADPSFLFKVGTEICFFLVIDSCCVTFAEVQKRGKDFWDEFELYAADLLVGIVVDVALVGMLAPYARIGKRSLGSGGLFTGLKNSFAALPCSFFLFILDFHINLNHVGCAVSLNSKDQGELFQRSSGLLHFLQGSLVWLGWIWLWSYWPRNCKYDYERQKGLLYGWVGFGCGLTGQGIANMIMNAKRRMHASERDVRVPPLVQSAVLWGVFIAVSSNARYQVINGLESVVEASPLVKQVPLVAMAFTVGVRFANNIYGGMQFVDWARLSGVH
ncbi:reticulata-related protein 1, chloroplastic [Tanacetum coccineum]